QERGSGALAVCLGEAGAFGEVERGSVRCGGAGRVGAVARGGGAGERGEGGQGEGEGEQWGEVAAGEAGVVPVGVVEVGGGDAGGGSGHDAGPQADSRAEGAAGDAASEVAVPCGDGGEEGADEEEAGELEGEGVRGFAAVGLGAVPVDGEGVGQAVGGAGEDRPQGSRRQGGPDDGEGDRVLAGGEHQSILSMRAMRSARLYPRRVASAMSSRARWCRTAWTSAVSLTRMPRPRRNSRTPSSRSSRRARRTVLGLTSSWAAISLAGGTRSPGARSPSATARRMPPASCSCSGAGSATFK